MLDNAFEVTAMPTLLMTRFSNAIDGPIKFYTIVPSQPYKENKMYMP